YVIRFRNTHDAPPDRKFLRGYGSKEAVESALTGRPQDLEWRTRRLCGNLSQPSGWSDLANAWDAGITMLRSIRVWWTLLAFPCSESTCPMVRTNMRWRKTWQNRRLR